MRDYYRMYIDESGDHSYGKALQSYFGINFEDNLLKVPIQSYPVLEDENKRYLALLGVIVKIDIYNENIDPAFRHLKDNYFREYSQDGPIIMHRKEIINRTGPFAALLDPEIEKNYNKDLLNFFQSHEFVLILVVIDKLSHIEKYGERAFHPYHYCMQAMLERYCGFLKFHNAIGDVLAESRERKENKKLRNAYKYTLTNGTNQRDAVFFHSVLARKLIIEPKKNDITGLQMSDLLVYPLKKLYLFKANKIESELTNYSKQICYTVKKKFNHHYHDGRIKGYGTVLL